MAAPLELISPLISRSRSRAGPVEDADAALVERARHDPEAFAVLYDAFALPVYGYCLARLGHREAAEDATSLVFAKALAALPAFRGGTFRGWLFTIAHHTVVDELRRRRPSAPLEAALPAPDPAPSPERLALANERRRALAAALARLAPDQRQVVELRLAGLSGAEVARATGRSPGAVAVAQHRAVRRLRALLADPAEPFASHEPARVRFPRDVG